jgi:hypothetical protein
MKLSLRTCHRCVYRLLRMRRDRRYISMCRQIRSFCSGWDHRSMKRKRPGMGRIPGPGPTIAVVYPFLKETLSPGIEQRASSGCGTQMMASRRGTLYAFGESAQRKAASLRKNEEGSMVREGFRKLRYLLMVLWYFVRKQPLKPPAELEEQLRGMPETQAQRMIRRWQRSRARSSE